MARDTRIDGGKIAETADASFGQDLVAVLPNLRRYAQKFCRDPQLAEDLAQTTALRAWEARASFAAGTNFNAWLFAILRNCIYSNYRRESVRAVSSAAMREYNPSVDGTQEWVAHLTDTARALRGLRPIEREAVVAMGSGLSYKELAALQVCPVGTIKSRVGRARKGLRLALESRKALAGVPHISFHATLTELEVPGA